MIPNNNRRIWTDGADGKWRYKRQSRHRIVFLFEIDNSTHSSQSDTYNMAHESRTHARNKPRLSTKVEKSEYVYSNGKMKPNCSTTRAAHEYLLEAARVTVAGGLVGGQKINISRMFRREVFSAFVVMKSARWRKSSSFFVENWMCALTQTTSPTQTKKQLANA